MSGYGPPPTPPAARSGSGSGLGLGAILGYVAGGLGVLDFIWGFLDFYSPSSGNGDGVSGYTSIGAGVIALTVLAGLIAAAETYEGKPTSLLSTAAAVGGLLLVFGTIVSDSPVGPEADAGIGLILALITSILQTGALVYAWLVASGKISAPQPKPQAPAGYGSPQGGPGGPGGYGAPSGYGPPQGGPGAYGAPQGPPQGAPQGPPQGAPQGPPPGAPQGPPPGQGGFGPPSSYGAPSSYGSPQGGQGGQGGPGGPGNQGPSGPPSGPPSSPPPPPPGSNPFSPPQGGSQH